MVKRKRQIAVIITFLISLGNWGKGSKKLDSAMNWMLSVNWGNFMTENNNIYLEGGKNKNEIRL